MHRERSLSSVHEEKVPLVETRPLVAACTDHAGPDFEHPAAHEPSDSCNPILITVDMASLAAGSLMTATILNFHQDPGLKPPRQHPLPPAPANISRSRNLSLPFDRPPLAGSRGSLSTLATSPALPIPVNLHPGAVDILGRGYAPRRA